MKEKSPTRKSCKSTPRYMAALAKSILAFGENLLSGGRKTYCPEPRQLPLCVLCTLGSGMASLAVVLSMPSILNPSWPLPIYVSEDVTVRQRNNGLAEGSLACAWPALGEQPRFSRMQNLSGGYEVPIEVPSN